MKSVAYGLLLSGLNAMPVMGDDLRNYSSVTLVASNLYGQEIALAGVPFAREFSVVNIQRVIPPGPNWDWVQFALEFSEGRTLIKTPCSAYDQAQDVASYDMMIPTHQLPSVLKVSIRVHNWGGTPAYDCAVYPNLSTHLLRPRR
jgi:hypothetical protein